jgi:aryl-alcohol dehydrogenase-like predicted oxidoreductase
MQVGYPLHRVRRDENGALGGHDGSPEYAPQACEASLRRLGGEAINLHYLHKTGVTKCP